MKLYLSSYDLVYSDVIWRLTEANDT